MLRASARARSRARTRSARTTSSAARRSWCPTRRATCASRDNPLVTGPPGICASTRSRHPLRRRIAARPAVRASTRARAPADQARCDALQDLAAWVELELHGGAVAGPVADAGPDALALMQERFLTVAAHELRTPLTLIRGYSEELLDPASGPLEPGSADVGRRDRARRAAPAGARRRPDARARARRRPRAASRRCRSTLGALVARRLRGAGERAAARRGRHGAGRAWRGGRPTASGWRALGAVLRNAIAWSPRGGRSRVGERAEGAGPDHGLRRGARPARRRVRRDRPALPAAARHRSARGRRPRAGDRARHRRVARRPVAAGPARLAARGRRSCCRSTPKGRRQRRAELRMSGNAGLGRVW